MMSASPHSPRLGTGRWAYTWYYVVPPLTLGLLAFVPFLHAATRLHTRSAWIKTAVYATGTATILLLGNTSIPEDAAGTISTLLILTMAITAPFLAHPLRSQLIGIPKAAAEERKRRAAARALAHRDPVMARELGIGLPPEPGHEKTYDDGGLIDVNTATAPQIAAVCRLGEATAARITQARDQLGGRFTALEEIGAFAPLSDAETAQIAEHAVLLR